MKKVRSENQRFWLAILVFVGLVLVQVPIWYGVGFFANTLYENRMTGRQLGVVRHWNELARDWVAAQQNYLVELDMVVPPANILAQEVEKLETLSDQSGVQFDIRGIKEEVADETGAGNLLKVATVDLELAGEPDKLLVFLSELEHLQELTEVTNLYLRETAGGIPGEGGTRYAVLVQVKFYLQNNGAEE